MQLTTPLQAGRSFMFFFRVGLLCDFLVGCICLQSSGICGLSLWKAFVGQGGLCECSGMSMSCWGQVIGLPTQFRKMNVLCLCILLAKYSNEFKWSKRIKKNCCSRMPSCLCSSARVCGSDSQWLAPSYSCTWPLGTWWQSCKCLCTSQQGMQWFPMVAFLILFAFSYSGFWWFLMVSDGFLMVSDGFCWFLMTVWEDDF